MTLKWHLAAQFLMGIAQVLNLLTTTVSPKWQPVVAGGLALCQLGLGWIAHHYAPDGSKL